MGMSTFRMSEQMLRGSAPTNVRRHVAVRVTSRGTAKHGTPLNARGGDAWPDGCCAFKTSPTQIMCFVWEPMFTTYMCASNGVRGVRYRYGAGESAGRREAIERTFGAREDACPRAFKTSPTMGRDYSRRAHPTASRHGEANGQWEITGVIPCVRSTGRDWRRCPPA